MLLFSSDSLVYGLVFKMALKSDKKVNDFPEFVFSEELQAQISKNFEIFLKELSPALISDLATPDDKKVIANVCRKYQVNVNAHTPDGTRRKIVMVNYKDTGMSFAHVTRACRGIALLWDSEGKRLSVLRNVMPRIPEVVVSNDDPLGNTSRTFSDTVLGMLREDVAAAIRGTAPFPSGSHLTVKRDGSLYNILVYMNDCQAVQALLDACKKNPACLCIYEKMLERTGFHVFVGSRTQAIVWEGEKNLNNALVNAIAALSMSPEELAQLTSKAAPIDVLERSGKFFDMLANSIRTYFTLATSNHFTITAEVHAGTAKGHNIYGTQLRQTTTYDEASFLVHSVVTGLGICTSSATLTEVSDGLPVVGSEDVSGKMLHDIVNEFESNISSGSELEGWVLVVDGVPVLKIKSAWYMIASDIRKNIENLSPHSFKRLLEKIVPGRCACLDELRNAIGILRQCVEQFTSSKVDLRDAVQAEVLQDSHLTCMTDLFVKPLSDLMMLTMDNVIVKVDELRPILHDLARVRYSDTRLTEYSSPCIRLLNLLYSLQQ